MELKRVSILACNGVGKRRNVMFLNGNLVGAEAFQGSTPVTGCREVAEIRKARRPRPQHEGGREDMRKPKESASRAGMQNRKKRDEEAMEKELCEIGVLPSMPQARLGTDFGRIVDCTPRNIGELHDKAEIIVTTILRENAIPPCHGKALMRILFDLRKLSEQ